MTICTQYSASALSQVHRISLYVSFFARIRNDADSSLPVEFNDRRELRSLSKVDADNKCSPHKIFLHLILPGNFRILHPASCWCSHGVIWEIFIPAQLWFCLFQNTLLHCRIFGINKHAQWALGRIVNKFSSIHSLIAKGRFSSWWIPSLNLNSNGLNRYKKKMSE